MHQRALPWLVALGACVALTATPGATGAQQTGTVSGTVFDSTAMAPLPGARVAVLGTSLMVQADDAGRFLLEGIEPGLRPVTFFHPRLQELGISASSVQVDVGPGSRQEVALAVPSEATLLRAWCAVEVQGAGFTPATGIVRDSITGVALPRATVTFSEVGRDGYVFRTFTARTDESGSYRVCDLPAGTELRMVAMFGRNASEPTNLRTPPSGALFRDIQLVLTAVGEIRGKVTDAESAQPLVGARIRVLGGEEELLTDEAGEFFLGDLPPGLHLLETEFLGYATQVDSVTIYSDEAILVSIPMVTNPIEIRGMTVTARARVGDPLTDLGRRQDLLTRPEVDALLPRVRTMGDLLSAAAFPGLSVRETMIDSGAGLFPGVCVEHNRVRRGNMGCAMITVYVNGMRLQDPATYLNDLDPNNVDSIELLSPTDAALRFGQQGVNGVVIITTRVGR